MNTKSIVFGLVIALVLSAGIASAFSNSGGGDWEYYKEITIKENSGKALSDYQVLVELNPSNFPGKAKTDGSDLRFAEDGKELSYWIEDYDTGARAARIWVKVPSIPANGEAKVKMYYGNEKAGRVSDGDATFEFFDDFERASLDKSKWDVEVGTGGGRAEVGNGICKIVSPNAAPGDYCRITSKKDFDIDTIFIAKRMKVTTGRDLRGPMQNQGFRDDKNWISHHTEFGGESWVSWDISNNGNRYVPYKDWTNVGVSEGSWYKSGVAWYEESGVRKVAWLKNDRRDSSMDYASDDYVPTLPMSAYLLSSSYSGGHDNTGHMAVDYCFVAKYTSPEPTISISAEFSIQKIPSLTPAKSAAQFEDDFSQPTLNNWIPFGSPSPRVLASVEGRSGVFDNNGDGWCDSGAVSKDTFSFPNGFTMESDVYVSVTNIAGCWDAAVIGLTKENTPYMDHPNCPGEGYYTGLKFGIFYTGDACWATPQEKRRHAYFDISLLTEDGSGEGPGSYAINADDYIDGWHNLKIIVGEDRFVSFYCDDKLIYKSEKRINDDILRDKKIFLGQRSSGSAGKAYHDYIKITSMNGVSPISRPTPAEGITISVDTVPKYKDTYVEGEAIMVSITVKENGVPRNDLSKNGFLIYEYLDKGVALYVNGKYLEEKNFDDSESSKGIYKITIEEGIPAGKHDKIYVCYGCDPYDEEQAKENPFFTIYVTPKEVGDLEIYLECDRRVKPGSEFEMKLRIKNPTEKTYVFFEEYQISTRNKVTNEIGGFDIKAGEAYYQKQYLLPDALADLVGSGAGAIPQAVRQASQSFFVQYLKDRGFENGTVIPPGATFISEFNVKASQDTGVYEIIVDMPYYYKTYTTDPQGMKQWLEIAYASWQQERPSKGQAYFTKDILVTENPSTPGFEAVFAIAGLLAVAYFLRRRK